SPATPEMKLCEFSKAWGGVAGVQSTLSVMLSGGLALPRVASLIAHEPARRFRIANKGFIAEGFDADLTLVDLETSFRLREEHLKQRNPPLSPYVGEKFRGMVKRTIRRGETIFVDGNIVARSQGELVVPSLKQ